MGAPLSPQTHNVYFPGSGIPIIRTNIHDEQVRRAEEGNSAASPEQIVVTFAPPCDQMSKCFTNSKRFIKLVERASKIMSNMGTPVERKKRRSRKARQQELESALSGGKSR